MILHRNEIEQFEQRYRVTFVNSLAGFRQAVLVGTLSLSGVTNLAIFNSLIHLGASPALFGLISRPGSAQRDTLQNIIDTKKYTLNFIKAEHYKKAHQTSARYDSDISEFDEVGLDEFYLPDWGAPCVKDAVVKIAMQLEDIIPITLNETTLIIGSVIQVELEKEMIGQDGFVNLSTPEVVISQGLDAYFVAKELGRLPYAKP